MAAVHHPSGTAVPLPPSAGQAVSQRHHQQTHPHPGTLSTMEPALRLMAAAAAAAAAAGVVLRPQPTGLGGPQAAERQVLRPGTTGGQGAQGPSTGAAALLPGTPAGELYASYLYSRGQFDRAAALHLMQQQQQQQQQHQQRNPFSPTSSVAAMTSFPPASAAAHQHHQLPVSSTQPLPPQLQQQSPYRQHPNAPAAASHQFNYRQQHHQQKVADNSAAFPVVVPQPTYHTHHHSQFGNGGGHTHVSQATQSPSSSRRLSSGPSPPPSLQPPRPGLPISRGPGFESYSQSLATLSQLSQRLQMQHHHQQQLIQASRQQNESRNSTHHELASQPLTPPPALQLATGHHPSSTVGRRSRTPPSPAAAASAPLHAISRGDSHNMTKFSPSVTDARGDFRSPSATSRHRAYTYDETDSPPPCLIGRRRLTETNRTRTASPTMTVTEENERDSADSRYASQRLSNTWTRQLAATPTSGHHLAHVTGRRHSGHDRSPITNTQDNYNSSDRSAVAFPVSPPDSNSDFDDVTVNAGYPKKRVTNNEVEKQRKNAVFSVISDDVAVRDRRNINFSQASKLWNPSSNLQQTGEIDGPSDRKHLRCLPTAEVDRDGYDVNEEENEQSVWNRFVRGSLIRLSENRCKRVEELSTEDFDIGSTLVSSACMHGLSRLHRQPESVADN